MRGRIPKKKDLERTILGILQSTAFLTTSAVSYSTYLCLLRKLFGGFNLYTGSYIPAFMSSITAIIIERPSRRNLLCLYVANVATETLWRMAVSRGMVKSIWRGQVLIFGISAALLNYYFRCGFHKEHKKDSIYDVIRFIVGKGEEGGECEIIKEEQPQPAAEKKKNKKKFVNFILIQQFLKLYKWMEIYLQKFSKHEKCPHDDSSCAHYTITGGLKFFGLGLGLQALLKLVLQIPKIIKSPAKVMKSILSLETMRIGAFLGGYTFLYRVSSSPSLVLLI